MGGVRLEPNLGRKELGRMGDLKPSGNIALPTTVESQRKKQAQTGTYD